ncbi:hypothetical protein JKY72_06035 [Candidatus Gracilibacteria bacterium]|nr:hypothetical protein [Candidatus Gracilibacteria bacterium]
MSLAIVLIGLGLAVSLFAFSAVYLRDYRLEVKEPSAIRDILFAVFVSGALLFVVTLAGGWLEGPIGWVSSITALIMPLFIVVSVPKSGGHFRIFGHGSLILGAVVVSMSALFMVMDSTLVINVITVAFGLVFLFAGLWGLFKLIFGDATLVLMDNKIIFVMLSFAVGWNMGVFKSIGLEGLAWGVCNGVLVTWMGLLLCFKRHEASSFVAFTATFFIVGLFDIFTPLMR